MVEERAGKLILPVKELTMTSRFRRTVEGGVIGKRPCRVLQLLVILSAFSLAALTAEGKAAGTCREVAQEALERLGLAQKDIREINLVARRQSRRGGSHVTGYDVWVRLGTCEGALVVDLSNLCRERQVYTRGDCKIEGVSAY